MSLFFLMCSERSGSNFITKLLNGHSQICGPSTKHIINPLARNLFRYQPIEKATNWEELLKDVYRLLNINFSIWKRSFSLDELRINVPIGEVELLIKYLYEEEAKTYGKSHTFIKENHVYEFLPFLLLRFPEAKYIFQTRDPRDMALSWRKNKDHAGGVVAAAKQWKQDQQKTLLGFNELYAIKKAIHIKYEELISNPEPKLKTILAFLGLQYEENILDFHKDEITLKNAHKQKAWENLSKGVMSDNSQKYLKELDKLQIQIIEKICYFEMRHLGYKPHYQWKDLEQLSLNTIEAYAKEEEGLVSYDRSKGVIENMEAKKIFYQKIID